MLSIDINLVFTIINLLVLFLLLKKFLYKPLNRTIENRKKLIDGRFADAEKKEKDAAGLKKQYESSISGAKKESERIIAEANEKAQKLYDKKLQEAQADADELIEKTRKQMAAEKAQAEKELQMRISVLAMDAALKILKNQKDMVLSGDSHGEVHESNRQ